MLILKDITTVDKSDYIFWLSVSSIMALVEGKGRREMGLALSLTLSWEKIHSSYIGKMK